MLFFQNETPTQIYSREFYETLKHHVYTFINISFTEQLRTAPSVFIKLNFNIKKKQILIGVMKKNSEKKLSVRGWG